MGDLITKIGIGLMLAGFALAVLGLVVIIIGIAVSETF